MSASVWLVVQKGTPLRQRAMKSISVARLKQKRCGFEKMRKVDVRNLSGSDGESRLKISVLKVFALSSTDAGSQDQPCATAIAPYMAAGTIAIKPTWTANTG